MPWSEQPWAKRDLYLYLPLPGATLTMMCSPWSSGWKGDLYSWIQGRTATQVDPASRISSGLRAATIQCCWMAAV